MLALRRCLRKAAGAALASTGASPGAASAPGLAASIAGQGQGAASLWRRAASSSSIGGGSGGACSGGDERSSAGDSASQLEGRLKHVEDALARLAERSDVLQKRESAVAAAEEALLRCVSLAAQACFAATLAL